MVVTFVLGISVGLAVMAAFVLLWRFLLDIDGCPVCAARRPRRGLPPATARQIDRVRRAQRLRVDDAK